jgi:ABC-type sugar transport system ATPase subunit
MEMARPLLQLSGATVRFGADAAIDGVDFRLFPGEVHSLMGENGAGKSTLIKAITGALPLDAGVLTLGGEVMRFSSPHDAQRAGRGARRRNGVRRPVGLRHERRHVGRTRGRAGSRGALWS